MGYFSCKRGVRQGDPLSPLLFRLTEEVLSRGISKLVQNDQLKLMDCPRGFRVPSHVLYADDILIFCKGIRSNIKSLQKLFDRYSEISGQFVSCEKSKIYSGSISQNKSYRLQILLGLALENYLSCISECHSLKGNQEESIFFLWQIRSS